MQRDNSVYSDVRNIAWQHQYKDNNPLQPSYKGFSSNFYRRGSRERRDIFGELESFMSL